MSNDSFKVKKALTLTPQDLTLLVSPEAGDIACDVNDSNKIKRYDSLASSWKEVGAAGGVGGVDILFAQTFDQAALSDFTQTGLVLSTISPLHGGVSALLVHQAGVPQSFKQVIAVDPKFRGLNQVLELNVKSNASAGNVTISVYDETNAASILASTQLNLSTATSGRKDSVAFTIPLTCASLSYTITALQEAGSPETRIDDIVCQINTAALLETSVTVPVITAWQSYIPTFQGFGPSPSAIEMQWRQNGENVDIRGKFVSGVATAVEARVGLPAGLSSAGTGVIPSIQMIGTGIRGFATAAIWTILTEPSVSYVTIGVQNGSNQGLAKLNGSTILANGDPFTFFASVPCAGLSATVDKVIPLTQSGLIQEGDSSLEINTYAGYGSTNTKIVRFSFIQSNIGSDILYSSSPTLGDSFTAQSTGIYTFSASINSPVGVYGVIGLTKNLTGTDLSAAISGLSAAKALQISVTPQVSGIIGDPLVSWSGALIAGDIIRVHTDGSVPNTAARCHLSATKQGSLKQVSVSSDQKIKIPTSELRFEGASSRGTGADTAIVKFDTLAKIRGDAFSVVSTAADGTVITMLKDGNLSISSSLFHSTAIYSYLSINQLIRTTNPVVNEILASGGGTSGPVANPSWSGKVLEGDVIRVSTNNTPVANGVNNLNLSFQEQDISVSVTNTLPQFSESDSSVRVDTANGYGSTSLNKIRRFSNVRDNIGTDVEYVDSAVNGASFTAKSSGIYKISYTDAFAVSAYLGISKNASNLTTNVQLLPISEVLACEYGDTATGCYNVTWSGYLLSGDVIRPHSQGSTSTANNNSFTMSKVGKPNVTGVDVTPFVNVPQPESQSAFITGAGPIASTTVKTAIQSSSGSGIFSYNTTTGIWTVLKACTVDLSFSANANTASIATPSINAGTKDAFDSTTASSGAWASCSLSTSLQAGETFSFSAGGNAINSHRISVLATALSDQILTVPETFSTDTAGLNFVTSAQYTLTTLPNAPVGTVLSFYYGGSSNTIIQSVAPAQSLDSIRQNGLLITSRASFAAGSSQTSHSTFAIQIGKGLKGMQLDAYFATGKIQQLSYDYYVAGGTEQGMTKSYNEITGVLFIDAGLCVNGATTTVRYAGLDTINNAARSSAYLVINASKNPALVGISLPRVYSESAGNAAQLITANFTDIPFIGISDTHGAWNGSQYVVPETGVYSIATSIYFTTAVGRGISLYTDTTLFKYIGDTSTQPYHTGSLTSRFAKGTVLSIRSTGAGTLLNTLTGHYITITKVSN
jgi:hypothetical protein